MNPVHPAHPAPHGQPDEYCSCGLPRTLLRTHRDDTLLCVTCDGPAVKTALEARR